MNSLLRIFTDLKSTQSFLLKKTQPLFVSKKKLEKKEQKLKKIIASFIL